MAVTVVIACLFYFGGYVDPNAEYAAEHTLALPIYPELERCQLDFIIESVLESVSK